MYCGRCEKEIEPKIIKGKVEKQKVIKYYCSLCGTFLKIEFQENKVAENNSEEGE
jgi:hypothetical protein